MAKKINEDTSTDLPIIFKLRDEFGWKVGDTLLYQQAYDIPRNLKQDWQRTLLPIAMYPHQYRKLQSSKTKNADMEEVKLKEIKKKVE